MIQEAVTSLKLAAEQVEKLSNVASLEAVTQQMSTLQGTVDKQNSDLKESMAVLNDTFSKMNANLTGLNSNIKLLLEEAKKQTAAQNTTARAVMSAEHKKFVDGLKTYEKSNQGRLIKHTDKVLLFDIASKYGWKAPAKKEQYQWDKSFEQEKWDSALCTLQLTTLPSPVLWQGDFAFSLLEVDM